jgi:hypothetical protein
MAVNTVAMPKFQRFARTGRKRGMGDHYPILRTRFDGDPVINALDMISSCQKVGGSRYVPCAALHSCSSRRDRESAGVRNQSVQRCKSGLRHPSHP